MLKQLRIIMAFIFSIATISILSAAVESDKGSMNQGHITQNEASTVKKAFSALTIADYEKQTGKKLGFFERIKFKLAQKYAKKLEKSDGSGKKTLSLLALILGGGSLLCLFILPLFGILMALAGLILGIVGLKKESSKTMAILGIVFGGLTLLLTIFFIILVASFSFV